MTTLFAFWVWGVVTTHQHIELSVIVRLRFVIEKLLRIKIAEYRNEACKKGIQRVLFENPEVARTSYDITMSEMVSTQSNHFIGEGLFFKNIFIRLSLI